MEEEKDFIHLESETYPSIALVADIGGAMGLFLGLSIIDWDFRKFIGQPKMSKGHGQRFFFSIYSVGAHHSFDLLCTSTHRLYFDRNFTST